MAILALTISLRDMRERISRIVIGSDVHGKPVTADDIGVTDALTVENFKLFLYPLYLMRPNC